MLNPKLRRLDNDFKKLQALEGPLFKIEETRGNPPNEYVLAFKVTGLMKDGFGNLVKTNLHKVRMILDGEYPRFKPKLEWLTPIFHPNFFKGGGVCIGDDWSPQYHIDEYVLMLGEMVQYKVYNVDSPANPEAAEWAKAQTNFPVGTEALRGEGVAPPPRMAVGNAAVSDREVEIKIF